MRRRLPITLLLALGCGQDTALETDVGAGESPADAAPPPADAAPRPGDGAAAPPADAAAPPADAAPPPSDAAPPPAEAAPPPADASTASLTCPQPFVPLRLRLGSGLGEPVTADGEATVTWARPGGLVLQFDHWVEEVWLTLPPGVTLPLAPQDRVHVVAEVSDDPPVGAAVVLRDETGDLLLAGLSGDAARLDGPVLRLPELAVAPGDRCPADEQGARTGGLVLTTADAVRPFAGGEVGALVIGDREHFVRSGGTFAYGTSERAELLVWRSHLHDPAPAMCPAPPAPGAHLGVSVRSFVDDQLRVEGPAAVTASEPGAFTLTITPSEGAPVEVELAGAAEALPAWPAEAPLWVELAGIQPWWVETALVVRRGEGGPLLLAALDGGTFGWLSDPLFAAPDVVLSLGAPCPEPPAECGVLHHALRLRDPADAPDVTGGHSAVVERPDGRFRFGVGHALEYLGEPCATDTPESELAFFLVRLP